jgi:hypothetical protein
MATPCHTPMPFIQFTVRNFSGHSRFIVILMSVAARGCLEGRQGVATREVENNGAGLRS